MNGSPGTARSPPGSCAEHRRAQAIPRVFFDVAPAMFIGTLDQAIVAARAARHLGRPRRPVERRVAGDCVPSLRDGRRTRSTGASVTRLVGAASCCWALAIFLLGSAACAEAPSARPSGRGTCAPGTRRGRLDDSRPGPHRRGREPEGARALPGVVRRGLRARQHARARRGRVSLAAPGLAIDLLGQRSAGYGRDGGGDAVAARKRLEHLRARRRGDAALRGRDGFDTPRPEPRQLARMDIDRRRGPRRRGTDGLRGLAGRRTPQQGSSPSARALRAARRVACRRVRVAVRGAALRTHRRTSAPRPKGLRRKRVRLRA